VTEPKRDDRVEKALEVLVYAPLGLGLWLRDLAPSVIDTVVARGRAEVDRRQEQAQQHITTARSMGQVAMAFGVPELRKRAARRVDELRGRADRLAETVAPPRSNGRHDASPPAAAPPADGAVVATAAAASHTAAPSGAAARASGGAGPARSTSSAHLPIPGYDALSASQVVERLAGLGTEELTAVRDYEIANRNRRTILGKIDQLSAPA
jgi:hypothetical protein